MPISYGDPYAQSSQERQREEQRRRDERHQRQTRQHEGLRSETPSYQMFYAGEMVDVQSLSVDVTPASPSGTVWTEVQDASSWGSATKKFMHYLDTQEYTQKPLTKEEKEAQEKSREQQKLIYLVEKEEMEARERGKHNRKLQARLAGELSEEEMYELGSDAASRQDVIDTDVASRQEVIETSAGRAMNTRYRGIISGITE